MDLNVVPNPPTFRLRPDASDYTSHQSQLAWDGGSCVPNPLPFLGNKPRNPVQNYTFAQDDAQAGAALHKAELKHQRQHGGEGGLRRLLTLRSVFATGTPATLGILNSSSSSIAPPRRARYDQLFRPSYRRRWPPFVCHGGVRQPPPCPTKPFSKLPSFSVADWPNRILRKQGIGRTRFNERGGRGVAS